MIDTEEEDVSDVEISIYDADVSIPNPEGHLGRGAGAEGFSDKNTRAFDEGDVSFETKNSTVTQERASPSQRRAPVSDTEGS